MAVRRALAALALAGSAFAPAAHADYPYTCDNVDCFVLWCVDHFGDCRDDSPHWFYCPSTTACFDGEGDISRYVAYCTIVYSPVRCLV